MLGAASGWARDLLPQLRDVHNPSHLALLTPDISDPSVQIRSKALLLKGRGAGGGGKFCDLTSNKSGEREGVRLLTVAARDLQKYRGKVNQLSWLFLFNSFNSDMYGLPRMCQAISPCSPFMEGFLEELNLALCFEIRGAKLQAAGHVHVSILTVISSFIY